MDNFFLEFLKYVWPILSLPIVWLVKEVSDLKIEHYETKTHAAQTYVQKNDYREDVKTLHLKIDAFAAKQDAMFTRILDKLDSKADKE